MLPLLRTVIMPIAISVLLFGCVTAGSKLESSRPETKLPAWVLNPDKPGYESVIGSAAKQDWGGRAAQYRVAMMKARQELAQRIRVRVESSNEYQIAERAAKVSSEANMQVRLQSSVDLSLENARVNEEWTDPQSGDLYIWLIVNAK